ncbi:hypothetical protein [Haliangium sp.]|uniref:hypothetical protein n=1 Tax=Haliangium sp. TaxID=2663208 RepID=UPI003D1243B6
MDDRALSGIVYLVLLVAGGAGLWIFILYQVLGRSHRHAAALATELAQVKRALATIRAELETRSMSDDELLDELADILANARDDGA